MKKNSGITLLALIITIIIMLILAGATISILSGNDGILAKAEKAVSETEKAAMQEDAELAIATIKMDYYEDYATNKTKTAKEFIVAKLQTPYETSRGAIMEADEDGNITYTLDGVSTKLTIDDDGRVTLGESASSGDDVVKEPETWDELVADLEANPQAYLAKAQTLGQTSTAAVGIGTDKQVVNLDMWRYFYTDDGDGLSLGDGIGSGKDYGYKPEYIQGGKIIGTVPQYIYVVEDNKVYPVTKMDSTFNYSEPSVCDYASKLIEAPEIPSTVAALRSTFYFSTGLTIVKLPNTVASIGESVFYQCESLQTIDIPESVVSIGWSAFRFCTTLSSVNIHNRVTSIDDYAFGSCTNLATVTFEHTTAPTWGTQCFYKTAGVQTTFDFQNIDVMNSFYGNGYYNTSYGTLNVQGVNYY